MKHALLVSVAALALTAASFASAQTQNRGTAPSAATPSQNASPPQGTAETTSPNTDQKQQRTTQQPNSKGNGTVQTNPEQKAPGAAQTQPDQKNIPSPTQKNTQTAPNSGPAATTNNPTTQNNPSLPQNNRGATQNNTSDRTMTTNNVSLTTEQKTIIRTKVLTSSAPRVDRVDFDLRVGVTVPRTVRVVALPTEIIEIQPAWRGYMYFVRGEEIVVVEPGTLRIVAILGV